MGNILGERRRSRAVKVGGLTIGGTAPVAIQSMNDTDTADVEGSLRQIEALAAAGCDLTRLAILNSRVIPAFGEICRRSCLPVVADIHFDYRLAIAAVEAGADKIRINPGNIGSRENLIAVVEACRRRKVPIRVGVNSGSLDQEMVDRYGGVTPEALAASALAAVKTVEDCDYGELVISLKASDPALTIAAYRLIAGRTDHPLHLGVTEAGTPGVGTVRSAVGIGTLLAEGIGDTIRVSLTGDPLAEVKAAKAILSALGLRQTGPTLISCPTCGRTQVDLVRIASEVEARLENLPYPVKVAVMGCAVNGPGEARDADIGIAGSKGNFYLFAKGERIGAVPENEAVDKLMEMVESLHSKGLF